MLIKKVSIAFLAFLILPLTFVSAQTKADKPFALVELFASEGCSSCPPADDLLMKLTEEARLENKRVFTLSFQVDYWNDLGWVDPFSQKEFSQRQYQYGQHFSGGVYTPQMIVNGQKAFVGSDEGQARRSIQEALEVVPTISLDLKLKDQDQQKVDLSYEISDFAKGMVLNVALVEASVESQVTAGENSGRLLKHNNVVRVFQTIPLTQKQGIVSLIKSQNNTPTKLSVIAYLQDWHTMQIFSAERIDL